MNEIERELAFLDKNCLGYKFLKKTIEVAMEKDKLNLCCDVFPFVAKKFGTNKLCVERNIRYLLKKANCPLSSKRFVLSVVEKLAN